MKGIRLHFGFHHSLPATVTATATARPPLLLRVVPRFFLFLRWFFRTIGQTRTGRGAPRFIFANEMEMDSFGGGTMPITMPGFNRRGILYPYYTTQRTKTKTRTKNQRTPQPTNQPEATTIANGQRQTANGKCANGRANFDQQSVRTWPFPFNPAAAQPNPSSPLPSSIPLLVSDTSISISISTSITSNPAPRGHTLHTLHSVASHTIPYRTVVLQYIQCSTPLHSTIPHPPSISAA